MAHQSSIQRAEVNDATTTTSFTYDAFLSYRSGTDYDRARKIETFLEAFHKSAGSRSVAIRPLQICRDGSDFTLPRRRNVEPTVADAKAKEVDDPIWEIIQPELSRSQFLLVLCSPGAVDSQYVSKEINWFITNRGKECVVPVVTEGTDPKNNPEECFPAEIIHNRLHESLIWYDLRGLNRYQKVAGVKDHEDELVRLATDLLNWDATTHGPLAAIWQREQSKRRRRQSFLVLAAAALLLALGGYALVSARQKEQALLRLENTLRQNEQLQADRRQAIDQRDKEVAERERVANERDRFLNERDKALAGEKVQAEKAIKAAKVAEERRKEAERQQGLAERRTIEAQNAIGRTAKALSRRGATLPEALDAAVSANEHTLRAPASSMGGAREGLSITVSRLDKRIPLTGPGVGKDFYFFKDGRTVITAGADGLISIWDIEHGTIKATMGGLAPPTADSDPRFISGELSPNERYFLGHFASPEIQVWELGNKSLVLELGNPSDVPGSVKEVSPQGLYSSLYAAQFIATFSPDGNNLAATVPQSLTVLPRSGRQSRVALTGMTEVGIWNLNTKKLEQVFGPHKDVVTTIAYSPTGRFLATAEANGTILVWAVGSKEPVGSMTCSKERDTEGLPNTVNQLRFNKDETRLFTAGEDGILRVWDIIEPSKPKLLATHDVFSPRSEELRWHDGFTFELSSTEDRIVTLYKGEAKLWRIEATDKGVVLNRRDESLPTKAAAFSPDGLLVVTAAPQIVRLWDAERGIFVKQLDATDLHIEAIKFSANAKEVKLITSSFAGPATVWTLNGDGFIKSIWGTSKYLSAADEWPSKVRIVRDKNEGSIDIVRAVVSPDRRYILTDNGYGVVQLMTPEGVVVSTLQDFSIGRRFDPLSFSKSGKYVLAQARDNRLLIFEVPSGRLIRQMPPLPELSYAALSPDGDFLAAAYRRSGVGESHTSTPCADSDAFSIEIIEIVTSKAVKVLRGHCGVVRDLDFSSDGKSLASAGEDNTARVWDLEGSRAPLVLKGHRAVIWHLSYSQQCQAVSTASKDSTAIIWDVRTGRPKQILSGHGASVSSAKMSDDCTKAITASGGTVRVWDAVKGKELGRFITHDEQYVRNADFLKGSDVLMSVGYDGLVKIYPSSTELWYKEALRIQHILSRESKP